MGRKSQLDERQSEILLNYYEVLKTEGVEGASLAKVAERMNCFPSILIHYFKNKNNMTVALVDNVTNKYEEYFISQSVNIRDHKKRLLHIVDSMLSPQWTEILDADVFYALMYLAMRNKKIKDRIQKMYKGLNEFIVQQIKLYQESGGKTKHSAEHIADMLIMLLEGYDLYRLVKNERKAIRELEKSIKSILLSMLGM
jgi:AcrR family transcriptional regulator